MRFSLLLCAVVGATLLVQGQQPASLKNLPKDPMPSDSQQLFGQWWTLQPGWHTELEIRNNEKGRAIEVEPVLRTASGVEIGLPKVSVAPDQIARTDLHEALATVAPNLADRTDSFGSIVFRFKGASWASVYASLMIHRDNKPISFHFDALPVNNPSGTTTRESIWWIPTENSSVSLLLSNDSDSVTSGKLELSEGSGNVKSFPVSVGPHQSQQLDVKALVSKTGFKGKIGGLRLSLNRNANRLYASK
jgi:hypothetical protein